MNVVNKKLYSCFVIPYSVVIIPLEKRELVCVLLVQMFVCFVRVSFCHCSYCRELAAVCDCGTPLTFLLTFYNVLGKLAGDENSFPPKYFDPDRWPPNYRYFNTLRLDLYSAWELLNGLVLSFFFRLRRSGSCYIPRKYRVQLVKNILLWW